MVKSRAELVIDISKRFMDLLRQLDPSWQTGYLRFRMDPSRTGCAASYAIGPTVHPIDAVENQAFFAHISEQGLRFLESLGKSKGVFILVADASSKYNFHFEFEDLDRWMILRKDGTPSIPADLPG
jgi:hypothetical protein